MAKKTAKRPAKKTAKTPGKKAPKKKVAKSRTGDGNEGLVVRERPDGIKGVQDLVWCEVGSLAKHPENWKIHTKRQKDALEAQIGKDGNGTVGWAGSFLYNLATNRLLDGHGRQEIFDDPTTIVPVQVGHWTEEEERHILLYLDPLAALAETDVSKYEELSDKIAAEMEEIVANSGTSAASAKALEDLKTDLDLNSEYVRNGGDGSFLPSMSIHAKEGLDIDDAGDEEALSIHDIESDTGGVHALKTFPEITRDDWKGRDLFDIPRLYPELIAELDGDPPALETWIGPETKDKATDSAYYYYIYGSAAIEKLSSTRMIVAFYTEDKKFNGVWSDPTKFTSRMLKLKIPAVTEVDHSVWVDGWTAQNIWQTFKTRWLARYWQEVGLKVIPNLTWWDTKDAEFDVAMAGIPKYANCLSLQIQTKYEQDAETILNLRRIGALKAINKIEPKQLIVYHSPNVPEEWYEPLRSKVDQLILAPTFMSQRSKVIRDKEYMTSDK